MSEEIEYAFEFKDHTWIRKLNAAYHGKIKELWMHAVPYADLRKFGRDEICLVDEPQKNVGSDRRFLATLDGIHIYWVRDQPKHHFVTVMTDGSLRVFCETHHVSLSGKECRYCENDTLTPVTEFDTYERIKLLPVEDSAIDKQGILPMAVYCGVSDYVQEKFNAVALTHQKICNRRHFGVENRWIFMFNPRDAWIEKWVRISVKCQLCGKEEILIDDCDPNSSYYDDCRLRI